MQELITVLNSTGCYQAKLKNCKHYFLFYFKIQIYLTFLFLSQKTQMNLENVCVQNTLILKCNFITTKVITARVLEKRRK